MHTKRTIGPTLVAVVDVPLGILGAVGAVMYLRDSTGAFQIGEAMSSAGSEMGRAVSYGGGSMMLRGLLGLGAFGGLSLGGIGLFVRAPWGRLCTLVAALGLVAFTLWRSTEGDMGAMNWITLAYGCALVLAFQLPSWRGQFEEERYGSLLAVGEEELKKAA